MNLWRDRRGAMIEKAAVTAGVLALAGLLGGEAFKNMSANGGFPSVAFLAPGEYVASRPKQTFTSIDYATTGSINERIVLDPCTGLQKTP
jgi:hypothetical protein